MSLNEFSCRRREEGEEEDGDLCSRRNRSLLVRLFDQSELRQYITEILRYLEQIDLQRPHIGATPSDDMTSYIHVS